jgi:hypothetical protein
MFYNRIIPTPIVFPCMLGFVFVVATTTRSRTTPSFLSPLILQFVFMAINFVAFHSAAMSHLMPNSHL